MKCDMTLLGMILHAVESWPPEGGDPAFTDLGYPQEEVMYTADQAVRAGLLNGRTFEGSGELVCRVFDLTREGRDFLYRIREQGV